MYVNHHLHCLLTQDLHHRVYVSCNNEPINQPWQEMHLKLKELEWHARIHKHANNLYKWTHHTFCHVARTLRNWNWVWQCYVQCKWYEITLNQTVSTNSISNDEIFWAKRSFFIFATFTLAITRLKYCCRVEWIAVDG